MSKFVMISLSKHKLHGLIIGISLLVMCLWLPSCIDDNNVDSSLDGKEVGVSANALLSSDRFNNLVIEVLYVKDFEPEQQTLDSLLYLLGQILHKPEGLEIVKTEVPSPNLTSYTLNDIRVIESRYRTITTAGKRIGVSIFFADEDYNENTENKKVLGIAYANTSLVVFEKTIISHSDQILEPDRVLLERTVVNHEFGHLLGLVNLGSDMQTPHQDEAYGKHCDDKDCLMNWETETGGFAVKLKGRNKVPVFDENCNDDLKANGGK